MHYFARPVGEIKLQFNFNIIVLYTCNISPARRVKSNCNSTLTSLSIAFKNFTFLAFAPPATAHLIFAIILPLSTIRTYLLGCTLLMLKLI